MSANLEFHPLADIFPPLEGAEFDALVADIKANGLYQAIILHGGMILDGRNRYRACLAAGVEPTTVNRDGWIDDPATYVISANIHRRHLTAEQKRELIAKLLKADPSKSDRQIAETVKASPTTVGTVRAEMEAAGDVSKLDTRTDTQGRQQPARKKTGATARERAHACREEKRRQKNEERCKQYEAEEAEAEAKAAQLAADLIKTNLAQRVLAYLTWNDDPDLLQDALKHLLNPDTGNDVDTEQSADKRRQEFAALEEPAATGESKPDVTAPKKRGRPKGSKNKPKSPPTVSGVLREVA